MNQITEHHLKQLGFEPMGDDADLPDHAVYAMHGGTVPFGIVVPKSGCSLSDLARIIYLSGQSDAKAKVRRVWRELEMAMK